MLKRTLLLPLILFFCKALNAQAPPIEWKKCYGGNFQDVDSHIELTADGGYIVAGATAGGGGDVSGYHGTTETGDAWVVKLDASGVIQWTTTLGGTSTETASIIHQAADGSYLVGGTVSSSTGDGDVTAADRGGGTDWWLVRLSPTGTILWQQRYGGEKNEYLSDFKFTPDGGYILTGYTASTGGDITGNQGSYDAWVVKLDAAGTLQWQRCIGGSGDDRGNTIEVLPTGYIVAGSTQSNNGNISNFHGATDALAARLDLNGNLVWAKALGSSGKDEFRAVVKGSDGGIVLAGYAEANDGDVTGVHTSLGRLADFWVVRLDDVSGSILWQHCYGGSKIEQSSAICVMPDGGYALAGLQWSSDGDIVCRNTTALIAGWVIKISSSGVLEWNRVISGGNWDDEHSLQPTPDGGLIVGGGTSLSNWPGYHTDLSTTGSLGDLSVVKLGVPTAPPPTGGAGPITVSVAPPPTNLCLASPATLSATATGAPSSYAVTWFRNGVDMQVSNLKYTASDFANGDQVYCKITVDDGCQIQSYSSNAVTMSVSANKAPTVSITASTPAACAGSPIDFPATVQGGSSGAIYHWLINGAVVAGSGPLFTNSSLATGDIVSCTYSDNTCYTADPIPSNTITAQIIPTVTPSVSITASALTICEDGNVKFSATGINAGTAPVYQWQLNGTPTGTGGILYNTKTLKDGDVISCVLTSNAVCSSPATTHSNALAIRVNPKVASQMRIDYAGPICSGDMVLFTAKPSNIISPAFNWILNGVSVSTASTFSSKTLSTGDVLICRAVETGPTCAQPSSAGVTLTVNPTPVVGMAPSPIISQGQTAALHLPITGDIAKYEWTPATGLSDASVASPLATPVKSMTYSLKVTTAEGCSAKGDLAISVISSITIPGAFSPNGDGKNEVFYVIGGPLKCVIKDFVVFDRWGRLIFQVHNAPTSDVKYGWDGRINGASAPGGTYVYEITVGFADGTAQLFKGTVLLVR